MNDLRYDPADPTDAHAPDLRETTHYDLPTVTGVRFPESTAPTYAAHVLTPAQLRTVPAPELRSPEARGLDTRTFDRQVIAELVRIVDVVQALALRVDLLEGEREAQL